MSSGAGGESRMRGITQKWVGDWGHSEASRAQGNRIWTVPRSEIGISSLRKVTLRKPVDK